jgi:hypothetical protein
MLQLCLLRCTYLQKAWPGDPRVKKMECRNKWSRATENFCPCFEASKPLLDTAVTREAKTLLQTWIDTKFASDCLMGFRVAFTCCFVKTFLMERAPFISLCGDPCPCCVNHRCFHTLVLQGVFCGGVSRVWRRAIVQPWLLQESWLVEADQPSWSLFSSENYP